MTELLRVLLYGEHAADLTRDGQRLTVTYTDGYAHRSEMTPISLSMPTAVREHTTRTVEPWLWGLLPDNGQVLRRWARDFHVSARNVFALLGHVGEDCAGAVQFVREDRLQALLEDGVEWLSADDMAEILRELTTDPTSWHQKNRTGQFSLAGAQPKTALHFDGTRWGRPSGRTPTTHILKPAVVGLDDHDLNEHVCLKSAKELGLRAATSRIASFGDRRAVIVQRYDRLQLAGGNISRIHQEDICQALSIHPDSKYQADRGPSPKDISDLFWRDAPRAVAAELTAQFTDALALNWLIAGTDAHAKNYSLLLLHRDVRLAPLYDLASALPYSGLDQHGLRLAMKLGNTYDLAYIGRSNWVQLAEQVGLPPAEVLERVADLCERLPEAMAAACSDSDVRELNSSLPQRLLDAVISRARECRARLGEHAYTSPRMPSQLPREMVEGAPAQWTPAAAAELSAALAPSQAGLIATLVAAGGSLTPEQARVASGRGPEGSLRGLTGPITKALNRLRRLGIIDESLRSPVRTVFSGNLRATRLELDPAAYPAFVSACSIAGPSGDPHPPASTTTLRYRLDPAGENAIAQRVGSPRTQGTSPQP